MMNTSFTNRSKRSISLVKLPPKSGIKAIDDHYSRLDTHLEINNIREDIDF